jgi:hypothetical protein
MLKELDDYSNYLSAEQYKRISEINKGKSIGLVLMLFRLKIVLLLPML